MIDAPYPVKTTDDMTIIFHKDKGIMIAEGDDEFFPFDPNAWPDCDDSAYFSALADVLAYVIDVAATRNIYNIPNVRSAYRIVDVIRTYERAIIGIQCNRNRSKEAV